MGSRKAQAFITWGRARGVAVRALDLRTPSFEHLRLSAIVDAVGAAISEGSPDPSAEAAVLIGSSLGGLAACRVAERDPRVTALLLMAPAFRLAERWPARLGDEAFAAWQSSGWLEVDDHATGGRSRVDWGFFEDMTRVDAAGGGWPDVRVPTLVLHGVHDEVVDVDLSRTWARGRPNAHLVELDDDHQLTASVDRILAEADGFFAPQLAALHSTR